MPNNLQQAARKAAEKHGVPVSLFYRLISQESGWNPNARNPSGATGLVQIHLPSHPDITEQQARDPAFAANWGAQYLSAQYKKFGDWKLALAAYNAGPGNVEKYGGIPPFRETQDYVKKITAGWKPTAAGNKPARSAPLRATVLNPGLPGVPEQTMVTLNSLFRKAGLPELPGLGDYKIGGRAAAASAPGAPTPTKQTSVVFEKPPKLPRVQRMVSLIQYARNLGLIVTENPYTDSTMGQSHVKGSHHYQMIGKHKGKTVGRAIDVSGDPQKLRTFFTYAEQYAGRGLDDLFYDPMGYSYDRGKKWGETIGGHGTHVHLSVK